MWASVVCSVVLHVQCAVCSVQCVPLGMWDVRWCSVVWCGVPKALLPKGNGRDVYPRVQVNGRAVCVARALCVVCVRWSSLLCHFVAAAGPVRLGGLVRLPWLRRVGGAAFAPCPPLRPPRRRTLGRTGCAAHCAALRAGAAAVLLLVLPWRCYWALEPTPAPVPIEGLWGCCTLEQFSSSSSRAVAGSNCGAATLSLRLSAACPAPLPIKGLLG